MQLGKRGCKSFTISEDGEAMKSGHFYHKGKKIIHNGVEKLVRHLSPRQMRNRLELVVDEKLRAHHDEAWVSSRKGKKNKTMSCGVSQ